MSFDADFFAAENPSAEQVYTGQGISIAVLDTGISPVADFTLPENRIVAFRDFVNGKQTPYDDNGHGTHVTGAKKESLPRLPSLFSIQSILPLCCAIFGRLFLYLPPQKWQKPPPRRQCHCLSIP